ncbi:29102_t:CDS:2 [Gigaspora margarita]|uniref:29102_t:CDS:1 n=1 Tax=Gigaspora margarita TaxID=4874 RepID=A0ABN7UG56_GIGMA|nr:29102_t:CDS:2 [Gigaspora margarita]
MVSFIFKPDYESSQQPQNLPAIGRPQITQNTVHQSISTSIAVQIYDDLVKGGNPFSELQGSVIPLQNTEFQTVLFEGLSP